MKKFLLASLALLLFGSGFSQSRAEGFVHSFAPFVGYRIFDPSVELKDSAEIGLKATEYFNQIFSIEGSLGYIPTIGIGTDKKLNSLIGYTAGANLTILPLGDVQFYASGGIWGFIQGASIEPTAYAGGGVKYFVNDSTATRIEGRAGFGQNGLGDVGIYFGFEKALGVFPGRGAKKLAATKPTANAGLKPEARPTAAEVMAPRIPSDDSSYLHVPSIIYSMIAENVVITDVDGKWYKQELESMVRYGIMTPTMDKIDPVGTVNRLEAAKMIVSAIYLQRLIEQSVAPIHFFIKGKPSVTYRVNILVKDSDDNEVKRIYDREKFYVGEHSVLWDGSDNFGQKLRNGVYHIVLEVYEDTEMTQKAQGDIRLLTFRKPMFNPYSPTLSFYDPVDPDWGKEVIRQSLQKSIIDVNFSLNNKLAQGNISKIDFIVSVSKGLNILGAEAKTAPELWVYRDKDQIPAYALNYLNIYTSELNYGGVKETSNLEPLKDINRAEAAAILYRLINWKSPAYPTNS